MLKRFGREIEILDEGSYYEEGKIYLTMYGSGQATFKARVGENRIRSGIFQFNDSMETSEEKEAFDQVFRVLDIGWHQADSMKEEYSCVYCQATAEGSRVTLFPCLCRNGKNTP